MSDEVLIQRPKYDEAEIQAFVRVAAKGEEVEVRGPTRTTNEEEFVMNIPGVA